MNTTMRHRVPLSLLFVFLFVVNAAAGVNTWTQVNLGPGVVWKQQSYTSLYSQMQHVNVLEVDLSNPAVTLRPIAALTSGSCERTSSMGQRTGALAAINGGFFASCSTVSMIKVNGAVLGTNPSWKPARATFGLTSARQPMIDWIASSNTWTSAQQALGGGPNLVTNGARDVTLAKEGFDSTYQNRAPRTAIGITSTNRLLLVTVDGRTPSAFGMTLTQLADYMISLGAVRAMNLDGGGSTAMYVAGQPGTGIVNWPSDNGLSDTAGERGVVSALGIYVTSLDAIVDNGQSGYSEVGSWGNSTGAGFYGSNSRWATSGTGSISATWQPVLAQAGRYEVAAWWVASSNRASNAAYTVHHVGGSSAFAMNQSTNGGRWNVLGTFDFASGSTGRVVLTNLAEAGKVVSADAVRFRYIGPSDVIVDNTDPGFSASTAWWAATSTPGYLGANYHVRPTASASDSATWSATLPVTGRYKVYARWTAGSNRATAAPYVVLHSGGSTTVAANQQQNNGTWVLLGTFQMNAGTAARVRLSCWTSSGSYVVADAVKFEPQ